MEIPRCTTSREPIPQAEHDQREIAASARAEIDGINTDLAEPV
jgi:hypothetical protein